LAERTAVRPPASLPASLAAGAAGAGGPAAAWNMVRYPVRMRAVRLLLT